MPTITVRYFAMLREERGLTDETLEVPDDMTAVEVYRRCCPEAVKSGLPIAFAINETHAHPTTVLRPGDDLVFIPPVGGG